MFCVKGGYTLLHGLLLCDFLTKIWSEDPLQLVQETLTFFLSTKGYHTVMNHVEHDKTTAIL